MVQEKPFRPAAKLPMLDVDVSYSEMWALRRSELAAWTVFVLVVGLVPLIGRRSSATAAEIRVQAVAELKRADAGGVQGSSWRLDVNTATEPELELLPGIGIGRARAILKEREKRGAFHTIWELTEVPGVTKALIQRLEPLLRAGSSAH
jgi:competence ComEA-like helix-hairpin-helix protein